VSQYHWKPEEYLDLMHEEVPAYERLQDETALATRGLEVARILELCIGTGETARRVLAEHAGARLVAVDSSEEMLAEVPATLGADLRVADLADPLPAGPFDLVVSALAVHHLEGPAKAELFRRVAAELRQGGRFVLADVVIPKRQEDAITPISGGYDLPDGTDDLLTWIAEAGFDACVTWADRDLAVIAADVPPAAAQSSRA
jgi:tRNA (cmo5U34)-methyltransferase